MELLIGYPSKEFNMLHSASIDLIIDAGKSKYKQIFLRTQ